MSGNVCLCTKFIVTDLDGITVSSALTKNYLYVKKYSNSVLEISFDILYQIQGSGGDSFYSQLLVDSTQTPTTLLTEHLQDFNGGTDGGGTRSGTLFPIIGIRTGLPAGNVYISLKIFPTGDDIYLSRNGTLIVREYNNFSTIVPV